LGEREQLKRSDHFVSELRYRDEARPQGAQTASVLLSAAQGCQDSGAFLSSPKHARCRRRVSLFALIALLVLGSPVAFPSTAASGQGTEQARTSTIPGSCAGQAARPSHSDHSTGATQLQAAVELAHTGDPVQAEICARAYLAAHADSGPGHFLLGYVFYREHKAKASLAEYTLGARFRQPSADDLLAVAMDYVLLNAYPDADRWLTKVVQMEPGNSVVWYYLGRTKYTENRFQEAVDAFHTSLKLAPLDLRTEYNLGLAYEGMGLADKAKAEYQAAISQQQNSVKKDPQPYLDLGLLMTKQGHLNEALPLLRRSVEIDPKNPKMHEAAGRVYEQLNELQRAQAEFEAAVTLAPNIPSLHFQLGRISKKEGLTQLAKKEFSQGSLLLGNSSTDPAETPNPDMQP
jgi:tetratricopeptide (TPR) repeat protein